MENNLMGVGGEEEEAFPHFFPVILLWWCSAPYKQATHLSPLKEFTELLLFAKFT